MIAQELNNNFHRYISLMMGAIPPSPAPPPPLIATASEITSIHFDIFSVMKVLKCLGSTYSLVWIAFLICILKILVIILLIPSYYYLRDL